MAHRYSQAYSAAEAHSPLRSSSTSPDSNGMYSRARSPQTEGRSLYDKSRYADGDDDDESEGECTNDSGLHELPLHDTNVEHGSSTDWNVYDDFNNARPRAAKTPSQSSNRLSRLLSSQTGASAGYQDATSEGGEAFRSERQQKRQTLIPSTAFGFDARNGAPQNMLRIEEPANSYNDSTDRLKGLEREELGGMELITVPALGAEYTNEEFKAMKKPHKRRKKAIQQRESAQKWLKSEDRYFGCLDPRTAIVIVFCSLAA
jgi:hypothetical protein